MVNKSTYVNKTDNHLSPQNHLTQKNTRFADENPDLSYIKSLMNR
jgi:hypothetical protein